MDERTLDILDKTYASIMHPESWVEFLDQIVDVYGLRGANIFTSDLYHEELANAWVSNSLVGAFGQYIASDYVVIESDLFTYVPKVLATGQFSSETALLNNIEREYGVRFPDITKVTDWLRDDYGVHRRYVSPLNVQPGYWDFLTLHVGPSKAEYEPVYESSLSRLLPHFAQAVELSRPFTVLQNRFNAVLEVLDKFMLGVVILDHNRHTVIANESARQMFDVENGLHVSRSCILHAKGLDQADVLQSVVTALQTTRQSTVSFFVSREAGDRLPYSCQVSALNLKAYGESGEFFLLVIVDPELSDIVDLSGVEEIFNLTHTESAVARYLVDGMSNPQIADARGVSMETVKSQVKAVMEKVDCSNRIELVNLAHRVNLPILKS